MVSNLGTEPELCVEPNEKPVPFFQDADGPNLGGTRELGPQASGQSFVSLCEKHEAR